MKYYSILKRKDILTDATMWMDFKDVVQSKISQLQKDKHIIQFTKVAREVKFIKTESRTVVARKGKRECYCYSIDKEFLYGKMKRLWR